MKNLKEKQRALRSNFPDSIGLRVHRSISWLQRAADSQGDLSAQFLFLWIAFNAAYAADRGNQKYSTGEKTVFNEYFESIVILDKGQRIPNSIRKSFDGPILLLMQNKYVFNPFWQHHNGIEGYENWEDKFKASSHGFAKSLQSQNTMRTLSFVFDRFYVLRNQIMHGGSTWNSSTNQKQVSAETKVLGFLVPIFVDVMMNNPHKDWGKPFYPVVD